MASAGKEMGILGARSKLSACPLGPPQALVLGLWGPSVCVCLCVCVLGMDLRGRPLWTPDWDPQEMGHPPHGTGHSTKSSPQSWPRHTAGHSVWVFVGLVFLSGKVWMGAVPAHGNRNPPCFCLP